MQDKDTIIEKIVTSPQSLTDAECAMIVEDEELRELYASAVAVSDAVSDIPDFDTDASLAQMHILMSRPRRGSFANRLLGESARKVAAIVALGISLVALAIVSVMYLRGTDHKMPETAQVVADDVPAVGDDAIQPSQQAITYDNAPLSAILQDIAERYDCRVECGDGVDTQSRFHFTIPADASLQQVVDMLNAFDEVKITVKGKTLIVE